jgi:hypothetical protein
MKHLAKTTAFLFCLFLSISINFFFSAFQPALVPAPADIDPLSKALCTSKQQGELLTSRSEGKIKSAKVCVKTKSGNFLWRDVIIKDASY